MEKQAEKRHHKFITIYNQRSNNLFHLRNRKRNRFCKTTLRQCITCPKNPTVQLSRKGTSAVKHWRFTCRLASKLLRPIKTTLNCATKHSSKPGSLISSWYEVMFSSDLKFLDSLLSNLSKIFTRIFLQTQISIEIETNNITGILTLALDFPTCDCRKRNCPLRSLTSTKPLSIYNLT